MMGYRSSGNLNPTEGDSYQRKVLLHGIWNDGITASFKRNERAGTGPIVPWLGFLGRIELKRPPARWPDSWRGKPAVSRVREWMPLPLRLIAIEQGAKSFGEKAWGVLISREGPGMVQFPQSWWSTQWKISWEPSNWRPGTDVRTEKDVFPSSEGKTYKIVKRMETASFWETHIFPMCMFHITTIPFSATLGPFWTKASIYRNKPL